jgi:hypothetical protein
MDDDDDTLRGMAQSTVPHTDRILKAMDRHILNVDMLKARRSTKGPGVANIGEASISTILAGKTSVHKMTTGVPQGGSLSSAPAEAIATVKTITLLLADVGLTLATTTDSKNVNYGLGT